MGDHGGCIVRRCVDGGSDLGYVFITFELDVAKLVINVVMESLGR